MTSDHPWIHDHLKNEPTIDVEEHDGTALSEDNLGLEPFSVGQWITQARATLSRVLTYTNFTAPSAARVLTGVSFTKVTADGTHAADTAGIDRRQGAVLLSLRNTAGDEKSALGGTAPNYTLAPGSSSNPFPFIRTTVHVALESDLFQSGHIGQTAFLTDLGKALISVTGTPALLCSDSGTASKYGEPLATAINGATAPCGTYSASNEIFGA